LRLPDDIGDEIMGGLRLRHVHADFHHHDLLVVAGDHVVHVGQALRVESGPIGRLRVKGHAADIPTGSITGEAVENPTKKCVVVSVRDVHHDLGGWENNLDRGVSGVDQSREVRHVGRGTSVLPKHSIVGLVAHLHPLGLDSHGREGVQDVLGV
jgi:hypothetical protein